MAGEVESTLQAGRDAIQRHAWKEACDLFSAEDAAKGLSPDDLELLAQAAWWIGRLGACIVARERAYTAFVEASARRPAALVALELAKNHFAKGDLVGRDSVAASGRATPTARIRVYRARLPGKDPATSAPQLSHPA